MTSPYRAAEWRDGTGINPEKAIERFSFKSASPGGTAHDPANGSSSSHSLERESGGVEGPRLQNIPRAQLGVAEHAERGVRGQPGGGSITEPLPESACGGQ